METQLTLPISSTTQASPNLDDQNRARSPDTTTTSTATKTTASKVMSSLKLPQDWVKNTLFSGVSQVVPDALGVRKYVSVRWLSSFLPTFSEAEGAELTKDASRSAAQATTTTARAVVTEGAAGAVPEVVQEVAGGFFSTVSNFGYGVLWGSIHMVINANLAQHFPKLDERARNLLSFVTSGGVIYVGAQGVDAVAQAAGYGECALGLEQTIDIGLTLVTFYKAYQVLSLVHKHTAGTYLPQFSELPGWSLFAVKEKSV